MTSKFVFLFENCSYFAKKEDNMAFKYMQLAAELQADISRGVYADKLPTEQALTETYGVSRQTVRQALDILVQNGAIEKRQGSGSRILTPQRSGGSDRIAVVTSYVNDYIFPTVLQDIQRVLLRRDYTTMLFATGNSTAQEREILQRLLRQPVAGLIVEGAKTALPSPNLDLYENLDRAGIPVVFLHGCYAALEGAVCVSDDNFGGGYMLARHLIARGHTKIAGIFKSDDVQGLQRYAGFCAAMRDAGLPIPDGAVAWYSTEERRYLLDYRHPLLLDHFLQFYLKDCTAVICYNDEIADSLIRALLERGRKVPGDVAVVSFDNTYYSDLCPVPITSLAHEVGKMGGMAATLLLDRLDGREVTSQTISWKLMRKASG